MQAKLLIWLSISPRCWMTWDALKRMIVGMARDAVHANSLIEKLRGELGRLKRAQFGVSSKKLQARVEQLEFAIVALKVDEARTPRGGPGRRRGGRSGKPRAGAPPPCPIISRARPSLIPPPAPARPAPDRRGRDGEPRLRAGPLQGGAARARGLLLPSLRDRVCRLPRPTTPIARGRARPGLLAHIAVAKFDDHLPLYRQAEIYARDGVTLQTRPCPAGWAPPAAALAPAGRSPAHGGDRRVGRPARLTIRRCRILAPGVGRTRNWPALGVCARRAPPRCGVRPPADVFLRLAGREGRASAHSSGGVLRRYCRRMAMPASTSYEGRRPGGALIEAACWAHPSQVLRCSC